jgi:hypothetical protein
VNDYVFCSDWSGWGSCCDSCHEDDANGYDTIRHTDWLAACCRFTAHLRDAGVNWLDEAQVRAFVATLTPRRAQR